MARSTIEWTEATWNPVTGCTKISAGCKNCYAERMARRLQAMGQPNYTRGFELTLHEDTLPLPLSWKRPQAVFVNSMSDLFHEQVPDEFIRRVFEVMAQARWHVFQVLTKRSERLEALGHNLSWPQNVWMGVSVESGAHLCRIDNLRRTPAAIRFISFEPLLEVLGEVDLSGIHWAIVGGESGPRARPLPEASVIQLRDQCQSAGVPFFFKQWGGRNKKKAGRLLEGRIWDDMPLSRPTACRSEPEFVG